VSERPDGGGGIEEWRTWRIEFRYAEPDAIYASDEQGRIWEWSHGSAMDWVSWALLSILDGGGLRPKCGGTLELGPEWLSAHCKIRSTGHQLEVTGMNRSVGSGASEPGCLVRLLSAAAKSANTHSTQQESSVLVAHGHGNITDLVAVKQSPPSSLINVSLQRARAPETRQESD